MSRSAFSRLYPNRFWKTQVTYDIRLTGSFQTMVTHGRSAAGRSSTSGISTGRTWGAAMPPIVPRAGARDMAHTSPPDAPALGCRSGDRPVDRPLRADDGVSGAAGRHGRPPVHVRGVRPAAAVRPPLRGGGRYRPPHRRGVRVPLRRRGAGVPARPPGGRLRHGRLAVALPLHRG